MRTQVRSLALLSELRMQHGHELWPRPAATALIRPLAWGFPYAMGAALKKRPKKKKKKKKKKKEEFPGGSAG